MVCSLVVGELVVVCLANGTGMVNDETDDDDDDDDGSIPSRTVQVDDGRLIEFPLNK